MDDVPRVVRGRAGGLPDGRRGRNRHPRVQARRGRRRPREGARERVGGVCLPPGGRVDPALAADPGTGGAGGAGRVDLPLRRAARRAGAVVRLLSHRSRRRPRHRRRGDPPDRRGGCPSRSTGRARADPPLAGRPAFTGRDRRERAGAGRRRRRRDPVRHVAPRRARACRPRLRGARGRSPRADQVRLRPGATGRGLARCRACADRGRLRRLVRRRGDVRRRDVRRGIRRFALGAAGRGDRPPSGRGRGGTVRRYDAVAIGSGINALVAGALLARKGWRVCVLERNDWFGGAIRTAEITEPGFVHEVFASWHPLFTGSEAYLQLRDQLEARGVEYLNTELPTATLFPDGESRFLTTSHPDNVAALGPGWDRTVVEFMPNADLTFGVLGTELWSRDGVRLA